MLRSKTFGPVLLWLSCLVLLIIPLKSYLHAGVPYTHDGENHLARFANYKLAIKEGQIPPRFAPNLMNRYGYPVFNYNYPLPSILSLPFSWLKLPYTLTFKLIVFLSLILAVTAIIGVTRHYRLTPAASLVASSIIILNPYLMSAILFRGSIGEVLSLSFFLGVWWLILKLKESASPWFLVAGGIGWAGFLLAHNVGTLMGAPLLIGIAALELKQNLPAWKRLMATVGIGSGLSLWFWLPALAEKSWVVLDKAGLSIGAIQHAPLFSQLLFAPTQFGFSYPGKIDSLGFSIGLMQVIVLFAASLVWWKYRTQFDKTARSWTLVLLSFVWILCLLQLPMSAWFWQSLPVIKFIQFPWRLTLFLIPILAMVVASVWKLFPRWLKLMVMSLGVIQAGYFWQLRPVDYRYLTNTDYDAFSQSTTTANENLPVGFTYLEIGDWQPTAKLLEGEGLVTVTYWKGSDRVYQLDITKPSIIVEPTMVFPGWQTWVEKEGEVLSRNRVQYVDSSTVAGRLAYRLTPGKYQVRTQFTQMTVARLIGNTVFWLTAAGSLGWVILSRFKIFQPKQKNSI
jgi:hypothetical protein